MSKKTWDIYKVMWLLTALVAVSDCIWAACTGLTVDRGSVMESIGIIPALVKITGLLLIISRATDEDASRKSFYQSVLHVFMWITVLAMFTQVGAVFQYLCVTTNFALVCDALAKFDAAIGFHWPDIYEWVKAHRLIHSGLGLAYASGGLQLFAIPFILAVTRNTRDYAEFVVQFIVSAILVMLISVPFPAESAYTHFGVHDPDTASTVSDFALFRSGHVPALVLSSMQGLVSFPSLHTILSLCFAYALRHVRFVFPISIVLNAVMILSTPTHGGHYLADVLSGLIVGVLVICCVRRIFLRSPTHHPVEVPLRTAA